MTSKWSNCSGKHTGMIALARHHGWPVAGYNAWGHPVQDRIVECICRWSGLARDDLRSAPDGCTAACFALPLHSMALAYARLVTSEEPAPRRILHAMTSHPMLVAGTGRLCTDLMAAWPGRVVAKVGADGVYSAGLPEFGLGIAIKVHDGHGPSSAIALIEVLRQVLPARAAERYGLDGLTSHARVPITNTRGVVTGEMRPAGTLRVFHD